MVNYEKSIGELIRSFRKTNKLSAKKFIEKLESIGSTISPAFITKLEVHGEIPSPDLICRLAEVIGYSPEELLKIAQESKIQDYHNSLKKKYKDALGYYRQQKDLNT